MSAAISEAKAKMIAGVQMLAEGVIAYIKELPEEFPAVSAGVDVVSAGVDVVGAGRDGGDEDIGTCTFPEAARLLNVSPQTVRRLCDRGEIEYCEDPRTKWRRPIRSSIREFHKRTIGVAKDGSK